MKPTNSGIQNNESTAGPLCLRSNVTPSSPPRVRRQPETKAERVLKEELARQQSRVRRMRGTDDEVCQAMTALRDLMQDPAFVALMETRGFATIPRLIHEHLVTRP